MNKLKLWLKHPIKMYFRRRVKMYEYLLSSLRFTDEIIAIKARRKGVENAVMSMVMERMGVEMELQRFINKYKIK